MRAAVEAALGDLVRAYVVGRDGAASLSGERGHLVVREQLEIPERLGASAAADLRRLDDALAASGGGRLSDAVRRDPNGAARRMLARAAWVPDLPAALRVQPQLPAGWLLVTRDGAAVVDPVAVRVGRSDAPLERRAETERLARELAGLETEARQADQESDQATTAAADARASLERARIAEAAAVSQRRRAEDVERGAGRALEAAAREAAWHQAQAERLGADAARARTAAEVFQAQPASGSVDRGTGSSEEAEALAAWESRVAEIRVRRDRIAGDVGANEHARREADARRARAEAAVALAEARIGGVERDLASLADRELAAGAERDIVRAELAAAASREARARDVLDGMLADDRAERAKLADAEHAATTARERLRATDDRARSADVAALEARLGLDALREQLLVELAGLGEVGLRHLDEAASADDAPVDAGAPADDGSAPLHGPDGRDEDAGPEGSVESAALEAALETLGPRWAAAAPVGDPPSPGRLAVLRRRFHELGAANPFAVDEYRSVRARLESLGTQDADLREAIGKTRTLIADLDALISTQFRSTFAALEVAFDARFQQLFGGGFAKLSLTDPTDLASTGIEITARPPGKKAQALSMLSGGERALTAVALLFAMLEVRPAPFCVLDEVDAALDEANVGRFTEALRGLAERTQFIVITHNRGTIEAADALYGVTVGDDSVSRVISLRLEEAQAIADHRRAEARSVLAGS